MQLMRYISELYYDNSKTVLNVVAIILSVLLLIEIIRCLFNKEKYVLNDWLQYVIVSVYVCMAGQILVLFNISVLDINSVDKILFFLIAFVCIVIYVAAQLLIYKKLGVAISQMFKCFSYLVYAVYFCLSVTKTLDFLEWYDGVLLLLCCETLARWIGYVVRKKVGANDENVKAVKSDHLNSDLYHDRKKQLDKFLLDLEDMKKEPYGIMISGEWGSGKSSFIKALKERLTEDCFIEIQAGSEKSIAEIMRELSSKIFNILRKNNVFVEDYSVIDEYFSAFSTLAEQAETGYIKSIFRRKNRNPIDEKSYLNEKLKELKKTIYIVIDDLDRCEDEHQDKAFKVIRECTELEHCKTIFLVDKNEFLKKY